MPATAIDAISHRVNRATRTARTASRRRSAVRQPYPSRPELPAQQPVFDDQVGDDFAFRGAQPEHQEQPLESRGVEHERQPICWYNTSLESWHTGEVCHVIFVACGIDCQGARHAFRRNAARRHIESPERYGGQKSDDQQRDGNRWIAY